MAETVLDVFRHQAEVRPEALAYLFLLDGERDQVRLSFGQLEERALALAATLQQHRAAGKRAVLLFAPGIDYLVAFYGCLAAGVIAVPAYPPDPSRLNRTLPRLRAMVADCQADFVLTTSDIHGIAQFIFQQAPELEQKLWIPIDVIDASAARDWRMPRVTADSTAFLQYTSGSTGSPKGVILSHGNLVHNLELITTAFGVDESTMGLSWLPPYHDMGLIGGILAPLYRGRPTALMSPLAFLQKPLRWLEAISRLDVTISGGPNFAYEMCLRKITAEERDTLDLSKWSLAFSGAEPVRADTIERFSSTFAGCGFRREAFYPCYGLAEATLIVSGGRSDAPPIDVSVDVAKLAQNEVVETADPGSASRFVSCGRNLGDQQVVIVDPSSGRPCDRHEVGEIWVAGRSVSAGYWENPGETARAFGGVLSDGSSTSFLRTGDLGFMRDGELFIAGRLKDLIIVRGRNLYPQDLERTVEESHPTLRRGCSAAFAIDVRGDEQLVVVVEVERRHHDRRRSNLPPGPGERRGPDRRIPGADQALVDRAMPFAESSVFAAISAAVAEQHGIEPRAIVLLKGGSIPKTSSGKIQRHECKASFLAKTLEEVARYGHDEPSSRDLEPVIEASPLSAENVLSVRRPERQEYIEGWLKAHIGKVLGRDPETLPVSEPITRFGLDSVMAIELSHALEKALGAILPISTLLRDASIRDVAISAAASIGRSGSSTIPPRSLEQEDFPLSRGQQALWFLHQLDPKSAAYNLATAWRIQGHLDTDRLKAAFRRVVERHPMLGARFRAEGDEIRQVPGSAAALDFRIVPGGAARENATAALEMAAREPFDLSREVLRVVVLSCSPGEHFLLLAAHHIALDFWSMVVILNDLRTAYARPGKLPPLVHEYRDFVRHQRQFLDSPAAHLAREYWRRQLGGELPFLDLPTDRPRGSSHTDAGATLRFKLPEQVSSAIRAFARTEGCTPFNVLLAAYQAVLCRWSQQTDIIVGTPLSGRTRAGFELIVGYFVNVLPIRSRLDPATTFRSLVGRVREAALDALEHEELPLLDIVDEVRPARVPGRPPLFQALFAFEKAFVVGSEASTHLVFGVGPSTQLLENLSLEPMPLDLGGAQFDVGLTCVDTDGPIACILQYSTALFDAGTVESLGLSFATFIEGALSRPEDVLANIPLLDAESRRRVVSEWNATDTPRDRTSVHEQVARRALASPHATALSFEGHSITYEELEERAGRLASHLRSLGVARGAMVAVCLDRDIDLVVSLLAVLKAGAAYVPLDPAYPRNRTQHMLDDSGAPVLIAHSRHVAAFSSFRGHRVLVDADRDVIGARSSRFQMEAVDESDLAYVIYTSGSTGLPKGVQVRHGALSNFLASMAKQPGIAQSDVLVAVTSLSFDIAALELFLPLVTGARIELASREIASDGVQLRALLEQSPATMMQATPSTWRLLVQAGWRGGVELTALCGGEALPPSLGAELEARAGHAWNLYGPTETTIWSSVDRIDGRITIGHPIANTELYVLDASLDPVPAGVPGLLYIGGEGLARGYLGLTALTAGKFVPDPFNRRLGGRMYSTGDRVRQLSDGRLEFLGRVDHQVKIRGFRIELGEIEEAIARHPGVREVVVAAREDTPGEKRLVAYVVVREGPVVPTADALRALVRDALPDHMIPSAFVTLERLPLTPNNKVDRKALPSPVGVSDPQEPVAFASDVEEILAGIMKDVLKVAVVGPSHSFFDLGGHSLMATQVIMRVEDALGVRVPVATLFQCPTARGLAGWMAELPDAATIAERAELVAQIMAMSEEEADATLLRGSAGH